MSDLEAARYLAILGLSPGASLRDVKQAYRDLAQVWHPDRFAHHPRLRAKAEEKLKDVNAAYTWLASHPEALTAAAAESVRPTPRATPSATPRRALLRPALPVVLVVGITFLAALALESRRRSRLVAHPDDANGPVATAPAGGTPPAAGEQGRPETTVPRRWPWRGVTITAASDAVPADVGMLVTLLGPHLNYVRLTLDGRAVAERNDLSPGAAWTTSLAWADAMLNACRDAGLIATVSLNQLVLDPSDDLTETSADFWQSGEQLDEVVRLAGELAAHFGGRGGELGGYEVLPKPFVLENNQARVPGPWPSLLRRIVAEIRKHDAARWIVVTPGPGGLVTGYRGFAPLDDAKLIYTADASMPSAYTRQGVGRRAGGIVYPGPIENRYWDEAALAKSLHALREFQVRHRVPVLIDEFGCISWAPGRMRYLSDLASVFGEYGWGWAYLDAEQRGGSRSVRSRETTGNVAADPERWKALESVFARFGAEPPA